MKKERLELFKKVENGELTPEQADEQLLGLLGVRLSLPTERDICKRAKIIKDELDKDKQEFCQVSYLMGALDVKNGDIPCNEA